MTTKPDWTIGQIIDQLDSSRLWHDPVVTYSMPGIGRTEPNSPDRSAGIHPMNGYDIGMAATAFELWDDLIAIDLVQTDDRDADIVLNYTTNTGRPNNAPNASYPGMHRNGSDIWIPTSAVGSSGRVVDFTGVGMGSQQFKVMVHEIGHSLGLEHPGDYNGGAVTWDSPKVLYSQDTDQFTVMSYIQEWEPGGIADYRIDGQQAWVQTPMLHDIAAIQAMYGADFTTRTGDTVYGFNSDFPSFGAGSVYNFYANPYPVLTIYDAGGNDTLDVSLYSQLQVIDLRPGHYSSIGGMVDNIAMAFNTEQVSRPGIRTFNPDAVIENAVGGYGQDVIWGNEAANVLEGRDDVDDLWGLGGNDILVGGSGDDFMHGGSGNDIYWVDSKNDHVVEMDLFPVGLFEYDPGGTDTVYSMADHFVLPEAVENLSLWSGKNGTGNALFNIITGNDEGNHLDGRGGNDWLIGNGGADWLDGGEGGDGMDGGEGHDQFVVDNGGDIGGDVVVGGSGYDEIWAAASTATTGLNLRLYASGTPITDEMNRVLGRSAAMDVEAVHGSSVGDDVIDASRLADESVEVEGYGGDDLFISGGGMDVFDGGADTDTIAYMGMPSNFAVEAVDGHDGWFVIKDRSSGVIDIIHDVETVMFGDGSSVNVAEWARGGKVPAQPAGVTLIGTAASDTLTGGDGNDRLEGGDGMDFLNGGAGADQLLGGPGMDFIDVDADDTLIDGGDGFDYVYLDSSKPYGASFKVAGTNVEYVGGTLADDRIDASGVAYHTVLNGNYGNDVLIGGTGSDGLDGSANDDTLTGGAGGDTFYFGGGWGRDTITDFAHGQDVLDLTGVDGLTSIGQLAITATAQGASIAFGADSILLQGVAASSLNAADFRFAAAPATTVPGQTLVGTAASDTLTGGDGNDRLDGGDGMDFLTGGAGADQLLGGAGTDFLYVDAGDTLIDGGDGFDYVYLDSSKPYGATFNVAGTNVEYVGGTLADDRIDASGVAYRTVLFGNYGNDVLIGGAGNDGLLGSAGDDTVTGGAGNDAFYFGGAWGRDTVTDFIHGQDVLDMTGVSGLTGMSQLTITDTVQGASIGFGADSILLQGVAAGSLSASDFHFLA